jgi:hypothetical protein
MAEFELILLLLCGLGAVLGMARIPGTRLLCSWLASTVLVGLAVIAPQALPVLPWQPWLLTAAIIGLAGALVTSLLMWYHWVLLRQALTVPPGTPPLAGVFLAGLGISAMSTGDRSLAIPLWIDIPLALNGMLMSFLLLVLILKAVRQAKQAHNNSGADSAS